MAKSDHDAPAKNAVRTLLTRYFQARAALTRKRFYCMALAGESTYNICVNSDMTVSCNCQDYDGSGHIGDLSENSLQEILDGPVAREFRRKLANGKLPIPTCSRCHDLQWTEREKAGYYKDHFGLPTKGIMVENTVLCNLDCIACSRKSLLKIRGQKNLNLDNIKKVSRELSENSIENVYYFNLGEPFLHPNILEELKILKGDNPELKITISTNGAILDTDKKRDAALLASHIFFSIDGVSDETLQLYQKNGSFEKAYGNMKALIEYRNSKGLKKPAIEWKYILFNWNDRKQMILKAVELAKDARVDSISFWPTFSPLHGISWRYYLGGFFKNIGVRNWKGREVQF